MREGYIQKDKRKKILLLTDDIRTHSGVGTVSKQMVLNTCHRYNWVQIAGSMNHPEKGKRIELSEATKNETNVGDPSVVLYPTDGYGNPELVRQLIAMEKPDAIFLVTDPRYFEWLFKMENEIRRTIPIVYLNIWDDYPAPAYNREFYESCDALFGISKQTFNINKIVLGEKLASERVIRYVPHGLDNNIFKPLDEGNKDLVEFKNQLTKNEDYDFILLYNSRNVRRKQVPDTILAWKMFINKLTPEQRKKCLLVLHTQPVDQHGTDLPAVIQYLFPDNDGKTVISSTKLPSEHMNLLYNSADGVILMSSNEGWGLALTEALLTGTPIIANVTGGMQDQMRFVDKEGKWFEPDTEVPSNHKGTYKNHGEWALPIYPSNISLVGSPTTPYIYDDRCRPEDAADRIMELYNTPKQLRKERGLKGMEWALGDEAGFTSKIMGERVIEGMDELFSTWEPRKKYEFLKDTDFKSRHLEHNLEY